MIVIDIDIVSVIYIYNVEREFDFSKPILNPIENVYIHCLIV